MRFLATWCPIRLVRHGLETYSRLLEALQTC